MRFVLDTNIVSDLLRNPRGRSMERIREVGEDQVCTSIVVAAELRYGAAKKGSPRLTAAVDAVLGVMQVLPLDVLADTVYGQLRARFEKWGQPIGGNDLLIAAQVVAVDGTLVTDNEREFGRIEELRCDNWLREG